MKNKTLKFMCKILCLVLVASFVLEAPLMALETIPVKVGGQSFQVTPGQWVSVRQGTQIVHYNVRYVNGRPVALEMSQYVKLIFGESSAAAATAGTSGSAASSGSSASTGSNAGSQTSASTNNAASTGNTANANTGSTANANTAANTSANNGSLVADGSSAGAVVETSANTSTNNTTTNNTTTNNTTANNTTTNNTSANNTSTNNTTSGKSTWNPADHPRDPVTGRFIKKTDAAATSGSSQGGQTTSDPVLPSDSDGVGLPAGDSASQGGQATGGAAQGGQATGDAAQGGQATGDAAQGGQVGDSAQTGGTPAGQADGKTSFKDKISGKFKSGYATGKSMTNQGFQNVKDSLKSGFSAKNLLVTAGITVGVDLATQIMRGEKPSAKKALKTICSAEFAGGVVGSVTGAAAGSFFVPFLSAIPVVGGFLGALAPTFGSIVGGSVGSYLAGDLKNGKFSLKAAFKQIDWIGVAGQTVGSTLGAMLGSMILPPFGTIIGGMIGGYLGNLAAHKIAGLFNKNNSGDTAAVAQPTGTNPLGDDPSVNGSVTISDNAAATTDASADTSDAVTSTEGTVTIPGDSAEQVGTYASEVQLAYSRYQELYRLYNELTAQGRQEDAQKIVVEMNSAKANFDELKAKSSK